VTPLSANFATVTGPDRPASLRHRIEALRTEIAQAKAKVPRMHAAIQIRQQTLSRLEARLALEESHPARTDDE
jgi:hypothetical protein